MPRTRISNARHLQCTEVRPHVPTAGRRIPPAPFAGRKIPPCPVAGRKVRAPVRATEAAGALR